MPVLKISRIGPKHAILLSNEVMAFLKAKEGDSLYLSDTPQGDPRVVPVDSRTTEHLESAEKVMDENRDELQAMAK